jgi:hypothetical protein
MSVISNMTEKNIWGPPTWSAIHQTAIAYPMLPSIITQHLALVHINRIIMSIPCLTCRNHAIQYIKSNPVRVETSYKFQVWAWRFHNFVNHTIDKPYMAFATYMRTYLPIDQLIYVSISSLS